MSSSRSTGRDGTFSPPLTSAASQSFAGPSRVNIVSRLVIDGKAKRDTDNATVKLYMKLAIPIDTVQPGQTIPLFQEENVRVTDFAVHPLDSDSVPYTFSSTTNRLVNNCALALNLPPRSSKSYLSLFEEDISNGHLGRSGVATNGGGVSVLEKRFTGYFLVSQYNVCYVVPLEFPPLAVRNSITDSDAEGLPRRDATRSARKARRSSVSGRSSIQFMAALVLSVPLSSKPPRAPYLLSIPIPRCLSNTVKFNLFTPKQMSRSLHSLSSDEDGGGWDVATEPHVNRSSLKHPSRSTSYSHFADDESSDSSVIGVSDSCIVHGTFTSSDHIKIRWALPLGADEYPNQEDGRKRVRVKEAQGTMTCTVVEVFDDESLKMRLDYTCACTGIWFPGVATMLGMGVSLNSPGCTLSWPSTSESRWQIDGDKPLNGFVIGRLGDSLSQRPSLELPRIDLRGSPEPTPLDAALSAPSRSSSSNSTSLLHAPLPQNLISDYSFDTIPSSATSALPSSVASLTPSATQSSVAYEFMSDLERTARGPSAPITLHLDMNELISSSKNKFTFNITGTVIVRRAENVLLSQGNDIPGEYKISLPCFQVTGAEKSTEKVFCRSASSTYDVELEMHEPVNSSGTSSMLRTKRTLLQNGSEVKASLHGSALVIRSNASSVSSVATNRRSSSASRGRRATVSSKDDLSDIEVRQSRSRVHSLDGPRIIPWLNAEVIPLGIDEEGLWKYVVTMSLPVVVDSSSDWFEFGFTSGEIDSPSRQLDSSPHLDVLCASIGGSPTRFEIFRRQMSHGMDAIVDLSEKQERQQKTWLRVKVANAGTLQVIYTVRGRLPTDPKGKRKASKTDFYDSELLLPVLPISVAKSEVVSGSDNLRIHEAIEVNTGDRKAYYSLDLKPFTVLSGVVLIPAAKVGRRSLNSRMIFSRLLSYAPLLLCGLLLLHVTSMRMELRELNSWSRPELQPANGLSKSVTITTTVTSTVSVSMWPTITFSTPPANTDSTSQSSDRSRTFHEFNDIHAKYPSSTSHSLGDFIPDANFITSTLQQLAFKYREHYGYAKDKVASGWSRLWTIVEIILHWPLPVDAN